MNKIWETIVRWRTLIFNGAGAAIVWLAPLLGAPELMAVVPPQYQKYLMLAVFLINYWMRPRPAVLPKEVQK